jgi:hypothetical protein
LLEQKQTKKYGFFKNNEDIYIDDKLENTKILLPSAYKFKYHFEFQKKNLKLNLHVDNVVIYNHANFQVKIPYILSCAKMKIITSIIMNIADF